MMQHIIEATEPDLNDEDTRGRLVQALMTARWVKRRPAKAAELSTAERQESANKAARARWAKRNG